MITNTGKKERKAFDIQKLCVLIGG